MSASEEKITCNKIVFAVYTYVRRYILSMFLPATNLGFKLFHVLAVGRVTVSTCVRR